MKITIEIEPNRFTRFLGSQASKVRTARQKTAAAIKSRYSAFRQGAKEVVSKPVTN